MSNCRTCKHWQNGTKNWHGYDSICLPRHPGTGRAIETEKEVVEVFGYRVRYCEHPKVLENQRPEIDGATVIDASEYRALLLTAEQFGCVLHEPKEGE